MRGTRASRLAGAAMMLVTASAYAEADAEDAQFYIPPLAARTAVGFEALDRPTGMVEFGFGWLTLPGASICVQPIAGCREGDTSFTLEAWQLYRQNTRFAFGAGLLLGLIPTTQSPLADMESAEQEQRRDYTRQYFTAEAIVRYYPYVGQNVEWWIGVTGGLVVVSDRFVVEDDGPDRALLGPQGVTVRSEGGSIGLAGGPVIALSPNWTLGATLRYGHWFLPSVAAVDPLGSQASLTGRNVVISLGVALGFRTAL